MTKLRCIILSTALLAGICSCRKAGVEENPVQIQTTQIMLDAGADGVGKVTLGSGLAPRWSDDDSLAVFDGVLCNTFVVSTNDGASAQFGGRVRSDAATLYAVYPFSAARSLKQSKLTVEFPQIQYVEKGDSSSCNALISVAMTTMQAKRLDFKNAYALLKMDIDVAGVTSVKITGKNGEMLSGSGILDMDDLASFAVTEGRTFVEIRPTQGTFSKGSYYVALPPVSFEKGFSVEMSRADGMTAVKTTDKPLVLVRNHGTDLSSVTFQTKWKLSISTAEELLAWNKDASARTEFDEVELLSDIDLKGKEWIPNDLKGTFEGNNHRIYNIVVSPTSKVQTDRLLGGFFARVYGTARNLVLGSADGTSYDGVSCVRLGSTTLGAWSFAGGVAATMAGGTLENIKSFSAVELTADFTMKAKIGGIVGAISSKGSVIRDCVNYGSVTNNAQSSTATADNNRELVAGIFGSSEDVADVVVSGSSNYGTITSNNPTVEFVGGIVAVPNGGLAATGKGTNIITIENCHNYGNIVLTDGAKPSVGGVVGCLCGANLTGCSNEGSIDAQVSTELKVGGIAGKFIHNMACSLVACRNGSSDNRKKGGIVTSSGTAGTFIGGILGNIPAATTADLSISGCVNYADLSTENSYAGYIGGFGGYWNASACVISLVNCSNRGNITNTSSAADAGNNRVAGFVGDWTNAAAAQSSMKECVNYGTVSTSKGRKAAAMVGGLCGTASYINMTSCGNEGNVVFTNSLAATNAMNVGGLVGYVSNQVNMKDCYNSAKVEVGASAVTGNALTGGLAGNMVNSTVDHCTNSGTICVLNGYNGNAYVGGLVGIMNGSVITGASSNSGEVLSTSQKTSTVGGIVGGHQTSSPAKITIEGCTNTGTVYASKTTGQFLVGGILGDGAVFAAVVKDCVNEGTIYATQASYAKQYLTVGGIVGRSRGKNGSIFELSSCVNRGTVTVSAITDNQLCNAGGIVGETNTYSTVVGNINDVAGVVTCENKVESSYATRTAYAGGISGGDNESTVGAVANDVVTGNMNYANVTATVTNGGTSVGAGGVFGMLQRTGTFTDNMVYGSPVISTGASAVLGGAGAVMGYLAAADMKGITAVVSSATTVNGVGYDAVKDNPAMLLGWLLPANNGNVSATIVDVE